MSEEIKSPFDKGFKWILIKDHCSTMKGNIYTRAGEMVRVISGSPGYNGEIVVYERQDGERFSCSSEYLRQVQLQQRASLPDNEKAPTPSPVVTSAAPSRKTSKPRANKSQTKPPGDPGTLF